MGNWNMTVIGVGAHHNNDYPHDANKLFRAFVEDLKAKGHHVFHASFTYGGAEDANIEWAPDLEDDRKGTKPP